MELQAIGTPGRCGNRTLHIPADPQSLIALEGPRSFIVGQHMHYGQVVSLHEGDERFAQDTIDPQRSLSYRRNGGELLLTVRRMRTDGRQRIIWTGIVDFTGRFV